LRIARAARLTRAADRTGSAAADESGAGLKVAVGAPVLTIYRWTSDHRGRPIEYVRGISPGDRYEYIVKLRQ
jgi:GntR family transcriptional regulator